MQLAADSRQMAEDRGRNFGLRIWDVRGGIPFTATIYNLYKFYDFYGLTALQINGLP